MQLTTKNIIKILSLDEKMKHDLLTNFDSFSSEKKFLVEQIVWSAYDGLFTLKLEEKLEKGQIEAEQNKTPLDKDFYQRMRKETEEELMSESAVMAEKVDLDTTREQLASVIAGNNGQPKSDLP